MTTSIFEEIASSITVKLICEPVGPILQAEDPFQSAYDLLTEYFADSILDPIETPSPVHDSASSLVGILWFDNYALFEEPTGDLVADIMDQILPHEFLSPDTTVLEAVTLFGTKENNIYYVLRNNALIGYLHFNSLMKPHARLSFFALSLEIEQLALYLCQAPENAERCWDSLSPSRKLAAKNMQEHRPQFNESNNYLYHWTRRGLKRWSPLSDDDTTTRKSIRLIECTTLIDRAQMISKNVLLPNPRDVRSFFHELQRIRNWCAHPGNGGLPIERSRLGPFIQSALQIRASLDKAIDNIYIT